MMEVEHPTRRLSLFGVYATHEVFIIMGMLREHHDMCLQYFSGGYLGVVRKLHGVKGFP